MHRCNMQTCFPFQTNYDLSRSLVALPSTRQEEMVLHHERSAESVYDLISDKIKNTKDHEENVNNHDVALSLPETPKIWGAVEILDPPNVNAESAPPDKVIHDNNQSDRSNDHYEIKMSPSASVANSAVDDDQDAKMEHEYFAPDDSINNVK